MKKASVVSVLTLVCVGFALSVVTAGVLVSQQSLSSSGSVGNDVVSSVNVGVFVDAGATVVCSHVEWGSLSPGGLVSKTVYVKNMGNVSETLSLGSSDWSPSSASSKLTLSWNKEGASLAPGAVVPATLTLRVAQDTGDLSSFSFNIVVSGSA